MFVVPLLVMSILNVTLSPTDAEPEAGVTRVFATVKDGRVVMTWAVTGPADTD